MVEELNITILFVLWVSNTIWIKLKASMIAGQISIIQFSQVKITHLGEQSTINIQDSVIISHMEMLTSVSQNILSQEKLEVIISSFQEKFSTGMKPMENYPLSILSLLLMPMKNLSNILIQQIVSLKKNLQKEKLKLNMD